MLVRYNATWKIGEQAAFWDRLVCVGKSSLGRMKLVQAGASWRMSPRSSVECKHSNNSDGDRRMTVSEGERATCGAAKSLPGRKRLD